MKLSGLPVQNFFVSRYHLRRVGGEPLTLQLRPLPLGFHQRLRNRGIVPPLPPLKIARDSAGKPLRDAQGMVLTLADQRQPEFLAELDCYHQCVAVLSVVEALAGDPAVAFETAPPSETATAKTWRNYAESIFAELEQAGFTAGDLVLLCREVCRLSNLIDEQLSAVQETFSPEPEGSSA
ncbi:hypothetical protein [Planctomicrobium piriforme]|uniref:Uncharacterized protein n=1 Tax=Planctomicrobium piriforme TaxID=1576369 RepID=A0A1I3C2E7_9PLAN|nr:hypothetical protein [Planctomicrobium piriforme]SFH68583.1 hypothetical protein SAMN05421753_10254 [Planctomicrobium piriforme]